MAFWFLRHLATYYHFFEVPVFFILYEAGAKIEITKGVKLNLVVLFYCIISCPVVASDVVSFHLISYNIICFHVLFDS